MINMEYQINMFSSVAINKEPDRSIPEGVKLKKNQLWCPYCSNIIKLVRDEYLGVQKCPYCGISAKDYHMRVINKLWR